VRLSLLMCSAVRLLFPPGSELHGVNAPAMWLKQNGGTGTNPEAWARLSGRGAILLAVMLAALWLWKRG